MPFLHTQLAAGSWFTLSLAEQMGNVGSEVERTISWYKRGEKEHWEKAFARALELLDLTLADTRWRYRLKEIARTREILCDVFYGENNYHVSFSELQKYFLEFGFLARK